MASGAKRYAQWLSTLVGGVGLALAVIMWQLLVRAESERITYMSEARAQAAATKLSRFLQALAAPLAGMAQRQGSVLREDRPWDIQLTGLVAALWVEPSGKTGWVTPRPLNEAFMKADWAAADSDRSALLKAGETGRPTLTGEIALPRGGAGFGLVVPVRVAGRLEGFLVGVFSSAAIYTLLLEDDVEEQWTLTVLQGDRELWRSGAHVENGPAAESQATALDSTFRVRAAASSEVVSRLRSPLPGVVLAAGAAIALLLAASVHFAQAARRRAAEAQASESALRGSEERLRATVDAAFDAVIAMDAEGRVVSWNPRAQVIFGWSENEALGRTVAELVIPTRYREDHARGLKQFLETGAGPVIGRRVELSATRRDGSEFPVDLAITTIKQGKIPLFVAYLADISERKRAEEALRESQAYYQALAESLPHMVWTCLPDGNCDYLSRQWIEYTGRPAEEHLGDGWLQQVHPDDIALVQAAWARAIEFGETYDLEFRIRRADGVFRWFKTRAVPLRDTAGRVVKWFGSNTDVEDYKQSQQKLQDQLALLSRLEEDKSQLVERLSREIEDLNALTRITANAISTIEIGELVRVLLERIVEVMRADAVTMLLLDGRELRTFASAGPAHLRDSVSAKVVGEGFEGEVAATLKAVHIEDAATDARVTDPLIWDRGLRSFIGVPLKRNGNLIGVLHAGWLTKRPRRDREVHMLEITAERCAAAVQNARLYEELRLSEERFRMLAETIHEVFWVREASSREMIYISPGYESVWGRTCASLLAAPATWIEAVHPEDREAVADSLQRQAEGNHDIEYRIVRPDGVVRHIHDRAFAVMDAEGHVFRVVGVASDVTERWHAQEALRSSLRDKDALLKEVHHRVKNNLQVITSLLRLEAVRNSDAAAKRALRDMQGRIQSMALLHETLYRSESYAAIDLGSYLSKLSQQLVRTLRVQGGGVELKLNLESVMVGIDQAIPCGLLVHELVSNCLKHAFPNNADATIGIELRRQGSGSILLNVSDTGVGLPLDFSTRMGQSLGLQLVSDLARQLGGRVDVTPGPGATFSVTFRSDESVPTLHTAALLRPDVAPEGTLRPTSRVSSLGPSAE